MNNPRPNSPLNNPVSAPASAVQLASPVSWLSQHDRVNCDLNSEGVYEGSNGKLRKQDKGKRPLQAPRFADPERFAHHHRQIVRRGFESITFRDLGAVGPGLPPAGTIRDKRPFL